MDMKRFYELIQKVFKAITKVVFYVSTLVTFFGIILKILDWGKSGPFAFVKNNIIIFWLAALTTGISILGFWLSDLHRRFVKGFSDNFRGNLQDNWDFIGPWRIVDRNTLIVTGSDEGGITKTGSLWENYTFTFQARIVNECLGVIVRAQDFNNYYMFQIWADRIRPHRRATVPIMNLEPKRSTTTKQIQPQPHPISFLVGWQTENENPDFRSVPIKPNLDGWFDVKVIVKGQSIQIYIKGDLILDRTSFLQIPTGKVGFRNYGNEETHVRDVRVVLQP